MRSGNRTSRRNRCACVLAAALAGAPLSASAVTNCSWTFNGSGSWSLNSNWRGGVPADGSDVLLLFNDAVNRTVTYNSSNSSFLFHKMTVDNTGTGSIVFSQSSRTFNAINEVVGETGTGYWILSGGTHNIFLNNLTFGDGGNGLGVASIGIGTMSGGSLNFLDGGSFNIGGNGAGTFTQSGGTISTNAEWVGSDPGTLSGTGQFIQSGGINIIGSAAAAGSLGVGAHVFC
jgi:hypothetical protein